MVSLSLSLSFLAFLPPSHVTHSTSDEMTDLAVGPMSDKWGNIRETDSGRVEIRGIAGLFDNSVCQLWARRQGTVHLKVRQLGEMHAPQLLSSVPEIQIENSAV